MSNWAACPHVPRRSSVAAWDDTWRREMKCAFPGPTATRCCSCCIPQVLGCHAEQYWTESWPRNYPSVDGGACCCYNYLGVRCVASCASNVRSHEVRSEYGIGVVTVSCSPGKFVLGCGMRPKYVAAGPWEKWRTWAVKNIDSCECYDHYGITCYALCGQLNSVTTE